MAQADLDHRRLSDTGLGKAMRHAWCDCTLDRTACGLNWHRPARPTGGAKCSVCVELVRIGVCPYCGSP